MYLPGDFSAALLLTILSAVFWGSWANTYKGTKQYPFELFYWDYILGVVLCTFVFAFTLGSHGSTGESFVENLHAADPANLGLRPSSGCHLQCCEPFAGGRRGYCRAGDRLSDFLLELPWWRASY
jgi:hypothetical protein